MGHLIESAYSLALALGCAIVVFVAFYYIAPLRAFLDRLAEHVPSITARRIAGILFAGLAFASFIGFAAMPLVRFYALQNRTSLDMALFDQTVWNSSAGDLFRSDLVAYGGDMVNGYFMPLILALVPLYAIVGDARTLLVMQTLALAAGALPVFWMARRRLGTLLALALSISFFFSPYFHNINLGSFHIISFAVPLLSFGLFFLLRRQYAPFFVCMFLLWMVKEETSLLLIGAGVYIFLFQRKFRLGFGLAASGLVASVIILLVVVPALTGKPYFVGRSYYTAYGSSMPEILKTMVTRPEVAVNTLLQPAKWAYLADLLVPLALLPLVGLDVLFVSALPVIGILLTNPNHGGIDSQYSATVFPTLYFAAIVGLERILARAKTVDLKSVIAAMRPALATLVVASGLVSYWALSGGPFARGFDPSFYAVTPQTLAIWDVMAQVPRQAAVAAQEELVANFSNRRTIYLFPGSAFYRSDYVVLDKERSFYDVHRGEVDRWLNSGYYEIVSDDNDFILARRREATTPVNVRFGDDMVLVAYTMVPERSTFDGTETLRPIVQWRALRNIPKRYRIIVSLVDEQGHAIAKDEREPQGGTAPTDQWNEGDVVNDQYILPLTPAMPGGRYRIMVQVYDPKTGEYLRAFTSSEYTVALDACELASFSMEKNQGDFIASELDIEARAMVDMREVRFIGSTQIPKTARAGSILPVGLYWRARQKPQGDYTVTVRLQDAKGQVILEQIGRPGNGMYPTIRWNEGEVVLDWHDLAVPENAIPGEYSVVVILQDERGTALGQTSVSAINIGE